MRSLAFESAFAKACNFCALESRAICASRDPPPGVVAAGWGGFVVSESIVAGGSSRGMVRHASMKDRMRRLRVKCAGSTDVEATYSTLFDGFLSSDNVGEAESEVVPERTEGKCSFRISVASSTRPERMCARISIVEADLSGILEERFAVNTDFREDLRVARTQETVPQNRLACY